LRLYFQTHNNFSKWGPYCDTCGKSCTYLFTLFHKQIIQKWKKWNFTLPALSALHQAWWQWKCAPAV